MSKNQLVIEIFGHPFNKPEERNWNTDPDGLPVGDREQAHDMELLVLYGGHEVGMMTNPDRLEKSNFIVTNGEKIVCRAQGGECRQYGEFYSPGLRDSDSWRTPVISHGCPDSCPYKWLVCDGHTHTSDEDVDIFIPFPHYNKFQGQFTKYCRDFDRIHQPGSDEELEGPVESECGLDGIWRPSYNSK